MTTQEFWQGQTRSSWLQKAFIPQTDSFSQSTSRISLYEHFKLSEGHVQGCMKGKILSEECRQQIVCSLSKFVWLDEIKQHQTTMYVCPKAPRIRIQDRYSPSPVWPQKSLDAQVVLQASHHQLSCQSSAEMVPSRISSISRSPKGLFFHSVMD